jgi:hypothetical protein
VAYRIAYTWRYGDVSDPKILVCGNTYDKKPDGMTDHELKEAIRVKAIVEV